MKYNWFDISSEQKKDWEKLCPVNHFHIIKPKSLPGIIPSTLKQKFDSVFVMASGSSDGIVYYMANGNRVDFKKKTIDQQPFGLAFVGKSPLPSGCLIQHGNWEGRTTEPPPEFWNHVLHSDIGICYPLSELPDNNIGSIYDLRIHSQTKAFSILVDELKKQSCK